MLSLCHGTCMIIGFAIDAEQGGLDSKVLEFGALGR